MTNIRGCDQIRLKQSETLGKMDTGMESPEVLVTPKILRNVLFTITANCLSVYVRVLD